MKFDIIPDQDALKNCCWCGKRIDAYAEVLDVGAKLRPEIDLKQYQSHCIQIELTSRQKTLNVMVTAENSEAKAEQKDLLFLVCTPKCGKALKAALKKDASVGDMIEKNG